MMSENEKKCFAEAWSCTVSSGPSASAAEVVWSKSLTPEDEEAALAEVRKKLDGLMFRRIYLILHEFGWPGTDGWIDWLKRELTLKRAAEQRCEVLVDTCDELEGEVDALKAKLAAKSKRAPKRKKR